jgi:hypothetical protein
MKSVHFKLLEIYLGIWAEIIKKWTFFYHFWNLAGTKNQGTYRSDNSLISVNFALVIHTCLKFRSGRPQRRRAPTPNNECMVLIPFTCPVVLVAFLCSH